ncbi:thioredoxin family protein [Paenibacillus hamazuiensis]|uniref:thioredoxin family protein n=1 Tax=Paenibacillus hamazuiensis TaxID=2936508 RepID=UPI00200D63D3|nr:thioredoxin domain-containing protein [Paenibacillus hamazuiensis]
MSIKQISDENFSASIPSEGVALVDFGAKWCPPCKVLLPILSDLEREIGDKVTIMQVDCDDSPQMAGQFGVMSMPTVILFKDGQPMEKWVGLRPKDAYKSGIAKYLS